MPSSTSVSRGKVELPQGTYQENKTTVTELYKLIKSCNNSSQSLMTVLESKLLSILRYPQDQKAVFLRYQQSLKLKEIDTAKVIIDERLSNDLKGITESNILTFSTI